MFIFLAANLSFEILTVGVWIAFILFFCNDVNSTIYSRVRHCPRFRVMHGMLWGILCVFSMYLEFDTQ